MTWTNARTQAALMPTTLTSVSREAAISVAAVGYGLTAAHLADGWAAGCDRFSNPFVLFGDGSM